MAQMLKCRLVTIFKVTFRTALILKIAVQGPVSRIVKYELFLIYDFINLGTSLRRSVIAFLEALCK